MSNRTARLPDALNINIVSSQMNASNLFGSLSYRQRVELAREEIARINGAGVVDWKGYRSLSRIGSRIAMGGRQKRSLFNILILAGYVG